MEARIAGIPCTIRLDHIDGEFVPAKINTAPEFCYEAEYPGVEFTVCDRRGRPAPWLARKMSALESREIEKQLLKEGHDE